MESYKIFEKIEGKVFSVFFLIKESENIRKLEIKTGYSLTSIRSYIKYLKDNKFIEGNRKGRCVNFSYTLIGLELYQCVEKIIKIYEGKANGKQEESKKPI